MRPTQNHCRQASVILPTFNNRQLNVIYAATVKYREYLLHTEYTRSELATVDEVLAAIKREGGA